MNYTYDYRIEKRPDSMSDGYQLWLLVDGLVVGGGKYRLDEKTTDAQAYALAKNEGEDWQTNGPWTDE